MYNKDFYPTPVQVIDTMLANEDLTNRNILEPSAGKGDIVDYCLQSGGNVIACEKEFDLQKILAQKCKVISDDFLSVSSEDISHVHYIVMNPPFSSDEKHILHAWEIAPEGCKIIALCNYETIRNPYQSSRKILSNIVDQYGSSENLGDVFSQAERKTGVEIGLIRIQKPSSNYDTEFEGFFLEEEPEEEQQNGMMSYNFVRDVVNRYIAAVKLYDQQAVLTYQMSNLLSGSFSSKLLFKSTDERGYPVSRNDFKKDLQKQAWQFIINKFNLNKYATRGLKEDISKFVENQTQVPFTMRNIYRMVEIIIGTAEQRMDKAIIEVFDRLTSRYHENRFELPGWKTNSHYLVNEKFIIDGICYQDQRWYKGQSRMQMEYRSEIMTDLVKALCFITGTNYDGTNELYSIGRDNNYGEWFEWSFFECKGFKKGTMHFKFKDQNVWAMFNQRVAKIKGFPLPENIKRKPH